MFLKTPYREVIARIIGSTLLDAKYIIHSFNSYRGNAIAVVMEFSSVNTVTIRCGSDGESLVIAPEDAEEGDLEEAGRIQIVQASDIDLAPLCFRLGDVVSGVTVELRRDIVKSIRIEFNESSIFVGNVGDELDFDESRFRQMVIDEESEPLTVVSF